MNIQFVKYRKIYYFLSAVLILGTLASLFLYRLNFGIDFTGGSILEVEYNGQRLTNQEITGKLSGLDLGEFSIQPAGDKNVIIRTKDLSEDTHQQLLEKLGLKEGVIEEIKFDSIGPVIGSELKKKTNTVIVISLIAIVVYIALAFRRVQRPVRSWQYGIASLVGLFHDVLIPIGVFSLLGKYYGVQVTIPIVAALLTVIGYSINNTVVVFDRVRENLIKRTGHSFEETVNNSINQTLGRSFSTSITTLLPLFAIWFFGGDTLKYFSLTLILGILAGLYSSTLITGPLLLTWSEKNKF